MKLPRGTDAQIGIPILAIIVVDIEPIRLEIANVDEIAVRRLNLWCFIPSVITGDCRRTFS